MTYKQAMEYIEKVSEYGSVLGLESITRLLELLNNPQDELKFIHVAGTNGKGSTIAYLEQVLINSSYNVGAFTSPHVRNYSEIIRKNGKNITQKAIGEYIEKIKEVCDVIVSQYGVHPTIFEIECAMAFLYFRDKKCDLVLLETGLGGKEDATNVVSNTMIAILTSISMDHMSLLGDTLEKIVHSKAGIIKEGCNVILYDQSRSVHDIIENECKNKNANLHKIDFNLIKGVKVLKLYQEFTYKEWKNIRIAMMGDFQIKNAILALKVVEVLRDLGYNINDSNVRNGLLNTSWFGRISLISKKPDFYVDGAHNLAAINELVKLIEEKFKARRLIFIMGVFRDKEYEKMASQICKYAEYIITITPPDTSRALHAFELANVIKKYNPMVTAADGLREAVEMAYLLSDKESVILAFGSLSFLGELERILD